MGRGAGVFRLQRVFVDAADVADADAILVVSFYVSRYLIDISTLFHCAVEADDVVVTYLIKAALAVPKVDVLGGVLSALWCSGAVYDKLVIVAGTFFHCL